ncbi:MAG: amidase, partial [Geminicoccaceae bacterium]|nr:amidase [Geminicoccaceae bacterium]
MSELLQAGAAELVRLLRAKKASARDVMQATLAAADAADRSLARGAVAGPLHGVPMAHKDMFYREGVASSLGSRIGPARPAPTTATVLKRLDAAGAIQFGVLHMT